MILGALESLESRLSNVHKIIKICHQQVSEIQGGWVLEQIDLPSIDFALLVGYWSKWSATGANLRFAPVANHPQFQQVLSLSERSC